MSAMQNVHARRIVAHLKEQLAYNLGPEHFLFSNTPADRAAVKEHTCVMVNTIMADLVRRQVLLDSWPVKAVSVVHFDVTKGARIHQCQLLLSDGNTKVRSVKGISWRRAKVKLNTWGKDMLDKVWCDLAFRPHLAVSEINLNITINRGRDASIN